MSGLIQRALLATVTAAVLLLLPLVVWAVCS